MRTIRHFTSDFIGNVHPTSQPPEIDNKGHIFDLFKIFAIKIIVSEEFEGESKDQLFKLVDWIISTIEETNVKIFLENFEIWLDTLKKLADQGDITPHIETFKKNFRKLCDAITDIQDFPLIQNTYKILNIYE